MGNYLYLITIFILSAAFSFGIDVAKVNTLDLAEYEIPHDIVFYDGHFVLVTELENGAAKFYKSVDTQTWEAVEQSSEMGVVDGLSVIDGKLYGAGYNTLDGHFIVSSVDMVSWEKEIIAPHPTQTEYSIYDYTPVLHEPILLYTGIIQELDNFNNFDIANIIFPSSVAQRTFYINSSGDTFQYVSSLSDNENAIVEEETAIRLWSDRKVDVSYNNTLWSTYWEGEFSYSSFNSPINLTLYDEETSSYFDYSFDLPSLIKQAYYETKKAPKAEMPALCLSNGGCHPDEYPGKDFFSVYKNSVSKVDGIFCYSSKPIVYPISLYYDSIVNDVREAYVKKSFYKEEENNWIHQQDIETNTLDSYLESQLKAHKVSRSYSVEHIVDEFGGAYEQTVTYQTCFDFDELNVEWSFSYNTESKVYTRNPINWPYDRAWPYDTIPPLEQILNYSFSPTENTVYRYLDNHLNTHLLEKTMNGMSWSAPYHLPYGKEVIKIVSGNGLDLILTNTAHTAYEAKVASNAIDNISLSWGANYYLNSYFHGTINYFSLSGDYSFTTDQFENFGLYPSEDPEDPYIYLTDLEGNQIAPIYMDLDVVAESGDLEDSTFLFTIEQPKLDVVTYLGKWTYSSWMAWFYGEFYPWTYTELNGWQYWAETESDDEHYYFDSEIGSWFWLKESDYPWVYKYGSNAGFYYIHSFADGSRGFYSPELGGSVRAADLME